MLAKSFVQADATSAVMISVKASPRTSRMTPLRICVTPKTTQLLERFQDGRVFRVHGHASAWIRTGFAPCCKENSRWTWPHRDFLQEDKTQRCNISTATCWCHQTTVLQSMQKKSNPKISRHITILQQKKEQTCGQKLKMELSVYSHNLMWNWILQLVMFKTSYLKHMTWDLLFMLEKLGVPLGTPPFTLPTQSRWLKMLSLWHTKRVLGAVCKPEHW